ncbi:hypothetical protein RPALISO_170 [Ruegeria phage RpAliso]|nr:hypothetical protein RPALISO_170 [Ruegeria phage RpAliso]
MKGNVPPHLFATPEDPAFVTIPRAVFERLQRAEAELIKLRTTTDDPSGAGSGVWRRTE